MKLLVTGGAGYIGSHVVKYLGENTKHEIFILDNLSLGKKEHILYGKLLEADVQNIEELDSLFEEHNFDAIIHFAANSIVSESVNEPLKYYQNNTVGTTNLILLSLKYKIKKFIFSSTAAVYGNNEELDSLPENAPLEPINPYGRSKLLSENILKNTALLNSDFKYVILRYFNVSGASLDGLIGESHDPETHLIPLVAKAQLEDKAISIFGDTFKTKDGTCVRDYIHVEDLAIAHVQALTYLDTNDSNIFNCGYNQGYSVKEIVSTMEKVTQSEIKQIITTSREGDPDKLVADNSKILTKMGWKPKFNNLELICTTSYKWERKKINEK